MSSKKVTDTKIPEDSDMDSGFLSGPIDHCPLSGEISGEVSSEVKSDEKKVPSVCVESEHDSGVLDVHDEFQKLNLETQTVVPASADTKANDLPPLYVLFKQDDDGDTQLHIAAIHGCVKAISTLLKVCPNKELLNVPNDDGHTALHLAVMSGNAIVTRMLVIAGAALDARDRTGETPLHKATSLKKCGMYQSSTQPCSRISPKEILSSSQSKNYNGQACVHVAASAGHVPTLQALVYYGADINLKENLGGWSALHVAAARGSGAVLEYLCRVPGVQARAADHAGRTPRRLARRHARLHAALAALDSDDDASSDDEYDYDSDSESLFEKLRDGLNTTLVA